MANTDSFIEEVSEEVRRDRLFALMRRWGWLAILLVLLLVGGAAYNEYRRATDRARAEAFGNALVAALDIADADARMAALSAVQAEDANAAAMLILLQAAEEAGAEQNETAAARLRALAETPGLSARYSDLALLKAHMLDPQDTAEAVAMLDRLAIPGAPYRPLAMEQQAYVQIAAGNVEAGILILRLLENESQSTPGLQQRASQLIVALEGGAVLLDTAPVPEAPATPDTGTTETGTTDTGTTETGTTDTGTTDTGTEGDTPPAEATGDQ